MPAFFLTTIEISFMVTLGIFLDDKMCICIRYHHLLAAYLSPVSPFPDVQSPAYLGTRQKFVLALKLTLKYVAQKHTHTHTRVHVQYGWTALSSSLTDSEERHRGQLLLPHLCSAVRAQSSL